MKFFDLFSRRQKNLPAADLTTITRTEIISGISTPGIIHNHLFYYTDLQVYSDGLICCWDMVDLALFKSKLNEGWVVTSIPDGAPFSISNLGHWTIENGNWQHTKQSFYAFIYSLVKQLNPSLENLHNYHGSNTTGIGKVQVAKHSLPDPKPYYLSDPNAIFPRKIHGEKFNVFYREMDAKTYLAEMSLFQDGHVELSNLPGKKTFKFQELEQLADTGTIKTELKTGETIYIHNFGAFQITSGDSVDIRFKLKEFTDKFRELNGSENSIRKCARIFEEYKQNPTKRLRDELKKAYEAIPEHQRIFVGTMDTRDHEVRQVIYGNVVKKEWEEEFGYEYPFDEMPKPIDED